MQQISLKIISFTNLRFLQYLDFDFERFSASSGDPLGDLPDLAFDADRDRDDLAYKYQCMQTSLTWAISTVSVHANITNMSH